MGGAGTRAEAYPRVVTEATEVWRDILTDMGMRDAGNPRHGLSIVVVLGLKADNKPRRPD